MRIAISAGHGSKIGGAVGPEPWGLDEYTENVRVMNRTAEFLRAIPGVEVRAWTDTISEDQDENLARLITWHNETAFGGVGGDDRLDISIHFNSTEPESGITTPIGTEVWYETQRDLAAAVASEIAMASGLIDRGAKDAKGGYYWLRNTDARAILIEVAFVMSKADCDIYRAPGHFDAICEAIATTVAGFSEA